MRSWEPQLSMTFLGIIALTIVTSMADSSVSLGMVLLKIVGFFAFALIAGVAFYYGYKKWEELTNRPLHRHAIMVFVFCLLLSYCAEVFFGVADITGAFVAGLVVSKTQRTQWLASKFDTISYMLLSPLFFASIGIKVVLPAMNGKVVGFTVVLVIVAVLTKVLGCGLGAKVCGYKNYQCARIGVGMISRGEVALIVADKGSASRTDGIFLPGTCGYCSCDHDYHNANSSEICISFRTKGCKRNGCSCKQL